MQVWISCFCRRQISLACPQYYGHKRPLFSILVWRLIRGAFRDKKLRKGMYVHYVHITYVIVLQEEMYEYGTHYVRNRFTGENVQIRDPKCSFSFLVGRSGDIWNFVISENIWRKSFGARPSGKSFSFICKTILQTTLLNHQACWKKSR